MGRLPDDAARGAAAGGPAGAFRSRGSSAGRRRTDRIQGGWTDRAGCVSRCGHAHGGVREPDGKETFVNAPIRPRRLAVALPLVLSLVAGCGYNTIQRMDEQVNAAESQIKVQ